jgi:hypothetical protein
MSINFRHVVDCLKFQDDFCRIFNLLIHSLFSFGGFIFVILLEFH